MEKGIIKCWKGDVVRCTGNEGKRIMNKGRAFLTNLSRRSFWQLKPLSNVACHGCVFTHHWLRGMFKKFWARLHPIFFVCSGWMLHGEKVSPYLKRQCIKCWFSASETDELVFGALFHSCSWRLSVQLKYFNTLNVSCYMVRQYRRKLGRD